MVNAAAYTAVDGAETNAAAALWVLSQTRLKSRASASAAFGQAASWNSSATKTA